MRGRVHACNSPSSHAPPRTVVHRAAVPWRRRGTRHVAVRRAVRLRRNDQESAVVVEGRVEVLVHAWEPGRRGGGQRGASMTAFQTLMTKRRRCSISTLSSSSATWLRRRDAPPPNIWRAHRRQTPGKTSGIHTHELPSSASNPPYGMDSDLPSHIAYAPLLASPLDSRTHLAPTLADGGQTLRLSSPTHAQHTGQRKTYP